MWRVGAELDVEVGRKAVGPSEDNPFRLGMQMCKRTISFFFAQPRCFFRTAHR
jgi:hypothetical protein